jgi:hypothetical protein
MNRHTALASLIRRNKYSENKSLRVLSEQFIKGNLGYTSNDRKYYIVGDSQVRFLIYKLIPLAVISHGSDLSINSNYTNYEITKHLSTPGLVKGDSISYISNNRILEDLITFKDDPKYAVYFKSVVNNTYAGEFPKLNAYINSILNESEVKHADTAANLQKFFEDYLLGNNSDFEPIKKQLLDLPKAQISAFDDNCIRKLSFIPFIESIRDFITINHVESYYDIVVNLAVTGTVTNSSGIGEIKDDIIKIISENPEYSKYERDVTNVFTKLSKAYSTIESKKLITPLAGKAADRDITNFFTMVSADQGREILDEISSEDTGILRMDEGKISSLLDKLGQWKSRFMTTVRQKVGERLSKKNQDESGFYIDAFIAGLNESTEDYNTIVRKVVQDVLQSPGLQESLIKSARKSNATYALLLKYAGKKEKNERLIDNSQMYFGLYENYIRELVSVRVTSALTSRKKYSVMDDRGEEKKLGYGYASNVSDLVFFNSFLKQIGNSVLKDNLSSSFVWSGFDLTESESTYVKGTGIIEIPIGFIGYDAKKERKDIMGQGEILRIEFKDSFIRLSTQSFYVKLVGQYNDTIAKAVLDGAVMDNRVRGNLQNVYTGASMRTELKELAQTNPEISELLKNKGDMYAAYCLSEEGDIYLDAMSGSNYYKKESIMKRGLTTSQLENVISKVQGNGYVVNSTKVKSPTPINKSFLVKDLENALAALERYVQIFAQREKEKLNQRVEAGHVTIGSDEYTQTQAIIQDMKNHVVIVMEFSVGDQNQFCTHFVYPLYGNSIYTDHSGVERVKQRLVGFFKRKTPAPRQAVVYEVKGADNSANDHLKMLRENSVLKKSLDTQYKKLTTEANMSFDIEDGEVNEFPLSLDGSISVEFPRVLERLGDYLDKYADPSTSSKVVLVFLGKELENTTDESGQYSHRIMENDYFSTAYKKKYAADINKIFFILKRIYDNNKLLLKIVKYKPVEGSGITSYKKIMAKFKDEYEKFGLEMSSRFKQAINDSLYKSQVTFDEVFDSTENILRHFTAKEGSGKDISQVVAEIEAEHNQAITDVLKGIFDAVQETVLSKAIKKDVGEEGDLSDSKIVKDFMEVATAIRKDTKELVSIVNKYKYEKSMLYDLIRSGRVKLYLDTVQERDTQNKKKNNTGPESNDELE